MTEISDIEYLIEFGVKTNRLDLAKIYYLESIAKTQLLILKELRIKHDG